THAVSRAFRPPFRSQELCTAVSAPQFRRTRRPPPATLFPYTPLFRSPAAEPAAAPATAPAAPAAPAPAAAPEPAAPACPVPMVEDRKSTRLNSSHVKISHAVFCSKKKTG